MTTAAPPVSLWPEPEALGPLTDLYELTMMAGYALEGMADLPATFDLFVRKPPRNRAYLVFSGLEQAIGDLMRMRFSDEQVEALRSSPTFSHVDPGWFDRLRSLRFTGDVWAVPEGSVVFPGYPLVRVDAPLEQAQWLETYLISALAYPTLISSKAARIVEAAAGRNLVEFGARRGHGPMAAFHAARSAVISGFVGTSHTEAAHRLGIPAYGTMAHSWVQSFEDEIAAFEAFLRHFPDHATLLVDTYDTLEGVRRACRIGTPFFAVRLDSGDLLELAKGAREILDQNGHTNARIFASGDLNEEKIDALVRGGAPIDAFGVGTELITSKDAPSLSMVYKLVSCAGEGRIKLSTAKKTYPDAKQIVRRRDAHGRIASDLVIRADEPIPEGGEPLLRPVLRGGRLVEPLPTLDQIRDHCRAQLASLPDSLRGLDAEPSYPVLYSDALERESDRLAERMTS